MTPASNAIKWYLLLVSVAPLALATSYNYITEYSGKTFFDEWNYFNNVDNLTNGDVLFLDRSAAAAQKLTYVNDAGNAIMKVDNSSTISVGDKRNSIRIVSKDRVNVGSVWIADFLHVPYGCSTWPAFWSTGPSWPSGGEIDTFEGINNNTRNTMTLHTEPGCVQRNAIQTSKLVNSTDCSYLLNGNQGCSVTDHETSSYGEAFHKAGGGLFVTEFAEKGISIWFFNRSSIPSELSAEDLSSFDTSNLGTPAANWPNTGCNMAQYFKPQNLIMDITLCGDEYVR
ncbi:glycoside hydrolase family 16 [Pyrrhoderma noxium]|uniref:Glycoside hydrolase family 16 n=1 Tax=Pyrrhoderma noxium TaxID=2282107 RepID=A0A286U683_9AGAM|nr:glycoside hydrolase family 16 [Pyrrhoderma noxium]